MRLVIPLVVFIPFTIFTALVIAAQGVAPLLEQLQTGWGLQVFLDLVIAAAISLTYIVPEARQKGINPWPYVALTPFLGSIILLVYFVHRAVVERRAEG